MLRKITFSSLAALALSAVVLGPTSLWSKTRGLFSALSDAVDGATPDPIVVKQLETGILDLDGRIRAHADKLADTELRRNGLQADIQRLESGANQERTYLRRAEELLAGDQPRFEIGGKDYAREDVSADALGRIANCRRLEGDLETRRKMLAGLDEALVQGRAAQEEARRQRGEMAGRLATQVARLQNARLRRELLDLGDSVRGDPLGADSDLAKQFAAFEARVRSEERRSEGRAASTLAPSIVDWEGRADRTADARAAIAEFLSAGSGR